MIRMDGRGSMTGRLRPALMALTAAMLAACARSAPAPVEFRPVFAAQTVTRQEVVPAAPRPEARSAQQASAPASPPAVESEPVSARAGSSAIQVSVLPKSAPAAAVASPPRVSPPPAASGVTDPPLPKAKPGQQLAAVTTDGPVALVAPPPRRQDRFAWPLNGRLISGFGPKPGGLRNDGINIAAAEGTPVRAAETGVVAYVGNELRGFGNLVLLRHDDGWMTAYAHVEQVQVGRGQIVQRGQVIAHVGRSGQIDRPQLHFEVRKGRSAVDPIRYLEPGSGTTDRALSRAAPPAVRPGPG